MNELALFAGAGGGILGSILLGHRIVCAVEIESYCREVLMRRQEEGHIQPFPIWDDVRSFDGRPWRGVVDIVSAGFPCQPFSVAGRKRGSDDQRNMWPDTIRVIREVGPRFAFLENVPHLMAHDYFGEVLGDLAEAGFDAEWGIVSAGEFGAMHVRERLWIFAYSHKLGGTERRAGQEVRQRISDTWSNTGWACEPAMGRVVYGMAHRVDRIKSIGNGQVPIVAATAWRRLMKDAHDQAT